MRVAIAGASGFVGKALMNALSRDYDLIALSRSNKKDSQKNIEWRACDLFSLLDAEKGLQGADVAVYLVHSMRPSAHLSQGSFEDFDLIVADNFVKAAERCGVKQIIYLGGLVPENQGRPSKHLESRREVEEVFEQSKVPAIIFRAAVIIGGEGSSFHIMTRLVERLPVMVCPSWTSTLNQPVALSDVCRSIAYALGKSEFENKTFDLGGSDILSYRDMMLKVAAFKGLKRRCIPFPFVTPGLSTLWVCGVTGAPKSLVRPLIEGLRFSIVARKDHEFKVPGHPSLSLEQALQEANQSYDHHAKPHAFKKPEIGRFEARSVQRLPLPKGWSAEDVAKAYMDFLPKLRPLFVNVRVKDSWVYFENRFPKFTLLELEYSPERSWRNRQLFYVRGGLLSQKIGRGRLEFREVLGGRACLAAIHDFKPKLPWFVYTSTQAVFHLWVMTEFKRYLKRQEGRAAPVST
ncbi:NAD(P)H-binding protein [Bdellovibrio svalbardensis]|uniref:NAD(P)H-binding protein n=1 Tax=Bdellovibrio svalbardensis TaxID=2972972 RepID=A0ABT6DGY8_9BACT|nr:NAD(P)H-binding protein [Bdellovibrio svalbardensis]MDG0815179.1 NAD(P)H-binding protein [Bdellovibrio svalbardensis]